MPSYLPRQEYLTATERVTRALRTAITTGALPAGAPIRQEEIAAQYQVSRIPVREAFRQLEAEGLIVIYPSRGAFVATLDPSDILEIYEIRVLLESDALRRACSALTPDIIQRAEAILNQLDATQESSTWGALDEAFHTTLYTPVQRPRLLDLIATLRRQVTHFYYLVTPLEAYRSRSQQEHRQILATCRAGDVAGAVTALEAHLHNSALATAASIQQRPGAGETQ
jgi:DNA-binding GntR family transcriptional regulator